MPQAKKAPVAAKAPAKEQAPKKTKVAPVPVSMTAQYVAGNYNPKATQNIESYAEVCKILPADYKTIQAKLPEHTDFVGYLIRRGGLVEK